MKYTKIVILIICLSIYGNLKAQVVINEYSCANLSYYFDNYTSYEDWIELYNPTAAPVNIGGYYLSDKLSQPTKWKFPPSVTINANAFLKIWASGRNEVIGPYYHTNFKLSQTKLPYEDIVLSDAAGNILDQVSIQPTKKHQSVGRNPDGGSTWVIYQTPSPNAANVTASAIQRYAQRPQLSVTPGFYTSPQVVTLTTAEPNSTIHFTINGREPSASSPLYTGPITVNSTTVIKAITISNTAGIASSFINFGSYFINDTPTLPVVSITGDTLRYLADGDETLKPEGTIEYFNINHVRKTAGYGTFNSHGQDSWVNDQRSLDFIMRDEFGYNYALQEQLFNLTPRSEFQRIILRAAGDDNYPASHHSSNVGSAHVRDAYLQNLVKAGGLDLDVRIATKAIVYINGVYWGVYDLREIPDDHDYTNYNYGQDKYHLQYIETWGNTWAQYGGNPSLDAWDSLYNYIINNSMANASNWDYVTSRLDVKSLVDYVIVNSVSVCSDWLNYNTGWWRGLDSAGTHKKWGYILWDNDAIYGFYINYTGIPEKGANAAPCNVEGLSADPNGHMEILGKLRQNPSFNNYYISRYIDLTNTVFSCDHMIPVLDSIVAVIDPEMDRHAQRWFGTYSEWHSNVQILRNYIIDRCSFFPSKMDSCYSLTGPYPLTLDSRPIGSGKIQINSLTINDFPWTGNYYGGIPVSVTAIPDTLNGFVFDHWGIQHNTVLPAATVPNVSMNFTGQDTLIAYFVQQPLSAKQIENSSFSAMAVPTVFRKETDIIFNLKEKSEINFTLCSSLGVPVLSWKQYDLKSGINHLPLNLSGKGISPGMYLLNLQSEKFKKTIRLVFTGE